MKILLVRLDGIGDALVCAPLVAALRDAGHTLGALLSTRNRDAFRPGVFAARHVVERIPWPRHGSTPGSKRVALAQARAERYDAALVASEELEAYAFARDAGIGRRVGFTNGWQKPLKSLRVRRLLGRAIVRPASARRAGEHEVATLFGLGAGLHDEADPTRDLLRLRPLVLEGPVVTHGRIVVQVDGKFVGSGIDEEAYIAFARRLAPLGAVAIGSDPAFVARIASAAELAVVPTPDVADWKAVVAGARAIVTPDGGAAHVAGMTGVPCVELFAAGPDVAREMRRWSPWAAPARTLAVGPTRDPAELAADVAAAVDELAGEPVRA